MTRSEILAFNAGIEKVAELAAQAAQAMRDREKLAPTRFPFATEALQAIADEAVGLAISISPEEKIDDEARESDRRSRRRARL